MRVSKHTVPTSGSCLFRAVVVLIIVIVAFAIIAVLSMYTGYAATPPRDTCGTIVRVDGSIVCTSTLLEPTDQQLRDWTKTHTLTK